MRTSKSSRFVPGLLLCGVATVSFAAEPAVRSTVSPERLSTGKTARQVVSTLPGTLSTLTATPLPDHESECFIHTMSCGQTVQSNLSSHDCELDDGTVVDFWSFDGTSGEKVTVNLSSSAFDPFLFLLNPTPEVVAVDDDGGPGVNARIVHTLDTSGTWTIAANNLVPNELGSYTLSLACASSGPGGPSGPLTAPKNLTAVPFTPTQVELVWDDLANNESTYRIEMATGSGAFMDLGTVGADTTVVEVSPLDPETSYRFRVRAENTTHVSDFSNVASTTTFRGLGTSCTPDATVLCLNDDRFQLQVSFRTPNTAQGTGKTGLGKRVLFQTADSGLVWFFGPNNWEMLVKLLDGCKVTDHYWVFFAATTDVELNVHVGDTETGAEKTYYNPLGQPADAITDTRAFDTCP